MAKPNDFDIPRLYYFQSGNVFTGSRGNFNFRIDPAETMSVRTWQGFLCSDLAETEQENSFPITEEGFADMLTWMQEIYQKTLR